MPVTVLCYDKCTTCRKAVKWLDEKQIPYILRPIREEHPDETELRRWHKQSGLPLRRFFNTSGLAYKALNLRQRLPVMSDDEQYALLASDGMLVKRPLLISENGVYPGFKESEWNKLL